MGVNRQARILIVDDQAYNLTVLQKMLAMKGYKDLELLSDSRQVIASYQAKRPNLILLDLNMPHLDGFQVLAQLQALKDPLLPPVVMITAQNSEDNQVRALSSGARDFITKPFKMDELIARVQNLLEVDASHQLLIQQNVVLEATVAERAQELLGTRRHLVSLMGQVVCQREPYKKGRSERVACLAKLIAAQLGWQMPECDRLYLAAQLYDVGMASVPEHILLSAEPLAEDARAQIRNHAVVGADWLAGDNSQMMQMAQEISLRHHEHWDGSGYPGGVRGDEIPQAARIVAVADVFEALISERPHRAALSKQEALDWIKAGSGSLFDPDVVTAFLAIKADGLAAC